MAGCWQHKPEAGFESAKPAPGNKRASCEELAVQENTNAVLRLEGRQAIFSPDSRSLAVFRRTNTVELWDVLNRSGVELRKAP
jgi:hypothetical protein